MDFKHGKPEETDLSSFYHNLKNQPTVPRPVAAAMPFTQSPDAILPREREKLKNNCHKHILLDIYCKILPLDKDYIDGHMGQMKSDIDAMLQSNGMTPTQYMTSCYQATKAPTLEFVIRSVDNIGKQFVEDAKAQMDADKEQGIDTGVPEAPEDPTDDENVNAQLVDVTNDVDYDDFVNELKKKTIDKIVTDVSKIITDEKEEQDMTFNPKPIADVKEEMESTTSIGMEYLQRHLIKENVDTSSMTEDLLGMAIRESTLNQFNVVFRQPGSSFRDFATRIRYNKGTLINESAVESLIEAAKSAEEVNGVVDQAKKEFDDKVNSKLKASDLIDPNNPHHVTPEDVGLDIKKDTDKK